MPHMMDDFPLLLSTLYDRAVRLHPGQQIVSVESDRPIRRTSYAETDRRVRQLATALSERLGLAQGQALATFAWNNQRHHELYWATANTGLVCHTLNVRLFPDQLAYIVNHAGDRALFVDPDLLPLVEGFFDRLDTVEHLVVMGDEVPDTSLSDPICYEELIGESEPWGSWPLLDERSPLMLCYTSGTTGPPKGVAYTQRSTYLHTLANLTNLPIRSADNVLPAVPMFHAAAWGLPFMAVTMGAKLTYPGPDLTPGALVRLFQDERVTLSAGVPTVWLGVQQHLLEHPEADLGSLRVVQSGGAAIPRGLVEWFLVERGIELVHSWGMTETNPMAARALLKAGMEDAPLQERLEVMESAGLAVPGLEVRIVDEAGRELPQDGEAVGELLVRGPWVAGEYYRDERSSQSFLDGWLRTGDVARIDPEGYIHITDRAKDLIRSGGEWISSLDLENHLMAHPGVAEAAVVAVKHARWQERPLALVVRRPDSSVGQEELLEHLRSRVPSFWLPDLIAFVDQIPKTGTGKFDKRLVRDRYADQVLED